MSDFTFRSYRALNFYKNGSKHSIKVTFPNVEHYHEDHGSAENAISKVAIEKVFNIHNQTSLHKYYFSIISPKPRVLPHPGEEHGIIREFPADVP